MEKMELTAESVREVLRECFFGQDEDKTDYKLGEGVMHKIGLHPDRLEKNRENIISLLSQLPYQFRKSDGGGWSFLNACQREDGKQWADLHSTVDQLVMLGNAIGVLSFLTPREFWCLYPGGMPYFVIDIK
jgi:hypothetical protein